MGANRVAVGFIHPGEVAGSFTQSLALTLLRDGPPKRITAVIEVQSSPRIAEGRSQVVDGFLHQTTADWLWMVDSDMAWDPEAFDVLCKHTDAKTTPIIGGLCFGGGRSVDDAGRPHLFPTIYQLVDNGDGDLGTKVVYDYPRDELISVGATGAAFLLVHRKVFTRMQSMLRTMPDGTPNPYPWFAEVVRKGRAVGEDITFCLRAKAAGFPIHIHTGARVRHQKRFYLDEALYDEMVAAALEEAE